MAFCDDREGQSGLLAIENFRVLTASRYLLIRSHDRLGPPEEVFNRP